MPLLLKHCEIVGRQWAVPAGVRSIIYMEIDFMADRFEDMTGKRPASRARGQSRARGSQQSERRSTSSRVSSQNNTTRSSNSRYSRRPDREPNYGLIIGTAVAAVILVGGLVFALKGGLGGSSDSSIEETTYAVEETLDPNSVHEDVYLDISSFAAGAQLLNINGMNQQQVKDAIKAQYTWNLVVNNTNPLLSEFSMPELSSGDSSSETAAEAGIQADNDGSEQTVEVENPYSSITIRPEASSFAVPDLIEVNLDEMIAQIFEDIKSKETQETEESSSEDESESSTETESVVTADYALALPDFKSQINDYMSQLATVWKMNPKNGDITSYDRDTGEFVFGGSVDGYELNAETTAAKVMEAINNHNYSSQIDADGKTVSASLDSIKDKYKIIGSFTTKTTSNSIRNGNIKHAAAAINGTVLQPGEEFSFNQTVGQRTEEKGYGGAPAYNEGEVVTEVGGGVCQVSSTLYNAVFRAGLTTTYRRSHTFAPTYVTPGTDATVSWPGPDYKFVNDSDHAIGIRTWYSDQTMNAQIYGVRVLPEGVSWELVSEKAMDLPVPDPVIITEGTESEGSAGSEWQAYKVIHKADGTTEKVKDHYTHYSGHTPKKYSPEIAASIAAEQAAAAGLTAATDENGQAVVETPAGESGDSTESTEHEAVERPEDNSEPEEENEPVHEAPSAPAPETNAETVHEYIEGPVPVLGDSLNEGLIEEGPVVGG